MSAGLLWLLAIGAGLTVANIYYAQPLLADIGRVFGAPSHEVGLVTTLTQLGYATGLLVFVPLADSYDRRKLMLGAAGAGAVLLVAAGLSPSLGFLLGASYLLGCATMVPQLSVPYAATLAHESARGQSVGLVMSGLLVGILLSRTASGIIAAQLGWRAPFLIAAGVTLVYLVVIWKKLPPQVPPARVPYRELLASLPRMVLSLPALRRHAVLGGCAFGAFSVFWTTLPFRLAAPPLHFGSEVAGLFGLVGVAGALGAPLAGRLADRYGSRAVNAGAIAVVVASYAIFALAGHTLVGLAMGVLLLDFGAQSNHVANQTRVLGLDASLRNRLNTVYMVTYFIGGASGSWFGSWAWNRFGWMGVCAVGAGYGLLALLAFFVMPGSLHQPARGEPV